MTHKIHLVYPSDYIQLKEALEEHENIEVVEWDFSISQFRDYSTNKKTNADAALINGATGTSKPEIFELLRQIRVNFPNLRLIIQFPKDAEKDKEWIVKIIGLGIYDVHFVDEFDIEDVLDWLNRKMTLADHSRFFKTDKENDEILQDHLSKENKPKGYELFSKRTKEKEQTQRKHNPFMDFDKFNNNLESVKETAKDSVKSVTGKFIKKINFKSNGSTNIPYETVVFFHSKGGVGSTTLLLHMAELYQKQKAKVGIVDFDTHIPVYRNLPLSMHANDVLKESFYFSDEEWNQITVTDKGIRYFLQPNIEIPITQELAEKVIRNMQRSSTVTLIDSNYRMDIDAQIMAISLATKVYWILDMTKVSINSVMKQKIKLKERGFNDFSKIRYIINRVHKEDMSIASIEDALEGKVVSVIHEKEEVSLKMNKGAPSSTLLENIEKIVR